ncbi:hypothetical protein B0H10DRAFT_2436894 [Mycena sp. CBHHK59/15]|nr:hypothetical protein B0H10DRAFT_2436894 [Mycena sp. CBHHK59/15]
MESYCPNPSPSSHASHILLAVLWTPTPSSRGSTPSPRHPSSHALCPVAVSSGDSVESPRAPPPVYDLYGLGDDSDSSSTTIIGDDNSDLTSTDAQRTIVLAASAPRLRPLAFLPQAPSRQSPRSESGRLVSSVRTDVFGPVRHSILSTKNDAQRRTDAERSAQIKLVRTAVWIRKLRAGVLVNEG